MSRKKEKEGVAPSLPLSSFGTLALSKVKKRVVTPLNATRRDHDSSGIMCMEGGRVALNLGSPAAPAARRRARAPGKEGPNASS